MALASISSVSFKNKSGVKFTSGADNDTEGQEYTPSQRRGTTDFAKMSVMVLLAMVPAASEGGTPKIQEMGIIPAIEVTENKTPDKDEMMTYVMSPKAQDTQQNTNTPFGYRGLKNDDVRMVHDFEINGEFCHLVLTSAASRKGANIIDNVYIVYDSKKPSSADMQTPPEVKRIIYHDIGKGKEFCGALIDEDIIGKDDKFKGTIRKEVRLDDDTAQILIDLITGYSKYENRSVIKLEEVQIPDLHPVKVLD